MRHLISLITLVFFIVLSHKIHAQIPTLNPFFFSSSLEVTKVSPSDLTSIGKYYADPNWNAGNLYLNNGDSLIAYYMRYDLVRNHVEVIIDTKIKAINGSFIDSLAWFSVTRLRPEKYVNKKLTPLSKLGDISGFPELLTDGNIKLYKCKYVFAPRQATSPTLVNDTDDEVQVLEKFYMVSNGELFEVTSNKRKNLDFINIPGLSQKIKQSNLRFSNERDLIQIVNIANGK